MDNSNAQSDPSPRHKHRVLGIVAVAVFSLTIILVAFGFYGFAITNLELGNQVTIAASTVAQEPYICDNAPLFTIHYQGIPAKKIQVTLDSQPLQVKRRGLWGAVTAQAAPLADGRHNLEVTSGSHRQAWSFILDTVTPTIDLRGPLPNAVTDKKSATFFGTTKPLSTVTVRNLNGNKTTRQTADERGKFNFNIVIRPGINDLKWTVCDRAGNKLEGQSTVACDPSGPVIDLQVCSPYGTEKANPKDTEALFTCRNLQLKLTVKDLESGIKSTTYSLDGHEPIALEIPASDVAPAETNTGDEEDNAVDALPENGSAGASLPDDDNAIAALPDDGSAEDAVHDDGSTANDDNANNNDDDADAATDDDALASKQSSTQPTCHGIPETSQPVLAEASGRHTEYTVPLNKLFDGDHILSVVSINGVGTPNRRTVKFKVNSSDKFGETELYLGACGADVSELQKRLVNRGYLHGEYEDGVYDEATKKAVMLLQEAADKAPSGICDATAVGMLSQIIYVNLSRFEVKLVDADDKVYTYSICTGVPSYPTPSGKFYVAEKVKDPTWMPPNSEWAKDSKSIEPGPNNPLGTRWIGLNNGAVGFHGTNAPWSVGTRASHGCMRMLREEVEKLYDQVHVGTQVLIFNGDEDSAILKHYWPKEGKTATPAKE